MKELKVEVNAWGMFWAVVVAMLVVVSFDEEIACSVGSDAACEFVNETWQRKLVERREKLREEDTEHRRAE